jgi:hypothetical protein
MDGLDQLDRGQAAALNMAEIKAKARAWMQ